jgi:glutamyl-tRNA synthetase
MRRGLQVEALRQFSLEQGASPNTNFMDWDKIWALNKKIIDPIAPRYTSISTENGVTMTLAGAPTSVEWITRPAHPKNAELGEKAVPVLDKIIIEQADAASFKEGEEVTLMDWGNAIVNKITRGADGHVTSIAATLHLAGDFKTTDKKITWLADIPDLVPADLIEFDYLITKNKIEPEEDIKDFLTEKTKYVTPSRGAPNLRTLPKGAIFQIPRRGFYIVDEAYAPASSHAQEKAAQCFFIPDGKAGAVSILGQKVLVRENVRDSVK